MDQYEQPAQLSGVSRIVSDSDYGDECVMRVEHGAEVRFPPYPIPCDYVRVVKNGNEIGYWNSQELGDAPAEVMGAILGAAMSGDHAAVPVTLSEEVAVEIKEGLAAHGMVDAQPLAKLRPYEQIQTLADVTHQVAAHWAYRDDPDLGVEERVMGAVHGVLDVLQNGLIDRVPAFQLIPIDPETDEGCVQLVDRNQKDRVPADWDYGTPFALSVNVQSFPYEKSPPASLTYRFEEHYENMRSRFRTSAEDLFGG
jgi:hypothetical protein